MKTASTHGYIPRVVDAEIDELISELPALVFEGAKDIGKAETARRRANTTWELDTGAHREIGRAEPERLLQGDRPVLIDEWQHVPESWDLVRRAVDAGAPAGAFLLTGSALPEQGGTHSGAGRIVSIRMRPLSLGERGIAKPTVSLAELLTGRRPKIEGHCKCDLETYVREILTSGFPALRGLRDRALRAQLESYITRIVDRDFPEMGHPVRNPATLRRWMAAYAAASSTTAKYETIRAAASSDQETPTRKGLSPYRDILERLWILDPVPAWLPSRSHIARLAQPPKHQLVDPALAAQLLGVDADALLSGRDTGPAIPRDGTLLGSLFDSLVTQSVRIYAQAAEAKVMHLRTRGGDREIDLIVERKDHRVVAIEIKLSQAPTGEDVRHLRWLRDELKDDLLDAVVITTGTYAYRRDDGVAVVPAALLGP